ncbi:uncharacterized protein FOMMEDRAFT_133048 [Fomitiporia mediterranea MF3/22]|uniref:uncharacterized protein n=1 Tax=Fomitiporia mediterranea (strain MF3/22) TaxID=694068 RepID=UPI00044098E9|nr:uncharacterized protein FOMMEDRAFT_133048 [Fomitiporia mediterranea MF3/22]EJD03629.1 hypothetical protein FOMMEDRAFT_133048 [Fomitiporia mediterranea MF3/22]
MSDPSVIDPHMKREQPFRSSRISASSYYPEQKGFAGRMSNNFLDHRDSLERRKSSAESRVSKEIDLTSDNEANNSQKESTELHMRDHRHSDLGIPAVPKVSASLVMTGQRQNLQKSPSEIVAMGKTSVSRSESRTASPVSANGYSPVRDDERFGKDRVANLRNGDAPANDRSPTSSARLSPTIRPKAASVSVGSLSGSNASGRPSPSIVTSFPSATSLSRNASVTSGTSSSVGSVAGAVGRQHSISRMRPVPPSRNPPPKATLPPTPQDRTPSPLTFRSPKNVSTSSLLNSPNSPSDDPSILTFDLPPSTPSSNASSVSLCFAPTVQASTLSDIDLGLRSTLPRAQRDIRSTNSGRLHRHEQPPHRAATSPTHTAKSSMSSNHTLTSAFGTRSETPMQRSVRKSISQSSITFDRNGRGGRQRVDSETSITSGNLMLEENPASVLNGMRTLRKQRSMHNTRAPGGSLAIPPLPQTLRHASSFNTAPMSEASGSGSSVVAKGDSFNSPFGSQRRSAYSSSQGSTAGNSLVVTPTTPQTQKKRSIFSSHSRDRDKRESGHAQERDKQDVSGATYSPDAQQHIDKKKSHVIGLGLFSGHFSPHSTPSHIPGVTEHVQEPPRPSSPPEDVYNAPRTSNDPPNNAVEHLDQHILPPKELAYQMEALADMEEPSSPPQFSDRGLESEVDDDYWEGSSIMTSDQFSMRSRINSISGTSITSGTDENGVLTRGDSGSLPMSTTTRHFANASGSIHERLRNDRPSTGSRLPTRDFSGMSGRSRISNSSAVRPSTADPLSSMRDVSLHDTSSDGYCTPIGLPPPPRRKGAAISTPTANQFEIEEPEINPLSPPPPRNTPTRLQRLPSFENQFPHQGLQRLPSHETITSYNPNRGSIFRKPSFLNIDDEFAEQGNGVDKAPMSTVPEDSFLILEHGKDSLDLSRVSHDL